MRPLCLVAIALVLSACGATGGQPSPRASVPPPTAPEEAGPDGPEPDQAGGIAALQAYGAEHADQFGGLYIDPPGGTAVTMLFTADLERHAAAVQAIAPGTTVRRVEHTEQELVALIESFDLDALRSQGIQMIGAGLDTIDNRVELEVKSNDPTVELRLELAHAGMLDVTVHPVPGPWENVAAGDGWRLLASGESTAAEAYTVRAATDSAGWGELWALVALDGPAPDVDLSAEVVVSFGHGIGSGCREVRLDGVAIDEGRVFSVTSDPLAPRGCNLDLAGAAVFVVALSRVALPDDGFVLSLSRDRVTGEGAGFTEEIDVALP